MTTSTNAKGICSICLNDDELFVTDFPFDLKCLCCEYGKHYEYEYHCRTCTPVKPSIEFAKANNDEYIDEAEDVLCSTCNGSGEGMWDGSVCRNCKGTGVDMSDRDE